MVAARLCISTSGATASQATPLVRIADRSGIAAYLGDVLHLLLQYRPENPVEFIADYFENVVNGVPAVKRAFRQLRECRCVHLCTARICAM